MRQNGGARASGACQAARQAADRLERPAATLRAFRHNGVLLPCWARRTRRRVASAARSGGMRRALLQPAAAARRAATAKPRKPALWRGALVVMVRFWEVRLEQRWEPGNESLW